MAATDRIIAHGLETFSGYADAGLSDALTVCIYVPAADDVLLSLLYSLKESPFIGAVFLYLAKPYGGGAEKIRRLTEQPGNKIRLYCAGDSDLPAPRRRKKNGNAAPAPLPALQGLNILAARAETKHLLFFEPRSSVSTESLRALYDCITTSRHRSRGLFFPDIAQTKPEPLLTPERVLIDRCLKLKRGGKLARLLTGKRGAFADNLAGRACLPVFCFAIEKRFFWKLGGFDTVLGAKAALQDLCISVCESDGEIAKCPRASVTCYEDADGAKKAYGLRDLRYIFAKHFHGMYQPGVEPLTLFLSLLRR